MSLAPEVLAPGRRPRPPSFFSTTTPARAVSIGRESSVRVPSGPPPLNTNSPISLSSDSLQPQNSSMASSDKKPDPSPASVGSQGSKPPGKPETVATMAIDAGAKMVQSMKPIQNIKLHACTFALYGHDLSRQMKTHHFISRLNNDFLQCAVYDSDEPSARLIGVEYVISSELFESLPAEEQKLWHSHAYEVKAGLWTCPRLPELVQKPELENLARTYGKFWCTWQVDRGDRLPLGAPALMMSPQGVNAGKIRPELVQRRDDRMGISGEDLKEARLETAEPEWIHPNADYWKQHGKGFALDVVKTEMKITAAFP